MSDLELEKTHDNGTDFADNTNVRSARGNKLPSKFKDYQLNFGAKPKTSPLQKIKKWYNSDKKCVQKSYSSITDSTQDEDLLSPLVSSDTQFEKDMSLTMCSTQNDQDIYNESKLKDEQNGIHRHVQMIEDQVGVISETVHTDSSLIQEILHRLEDIERENKCLKNRMQNLELENKNLRMKLKTSVKQAPGQELNEEANKIDQKDEVSASHNINDAQEDNDPNTEKEISSNGVNREQLVIDKSKHRDPIGKNIQVIGIWNSQPKYIDKNKFFGRKRVYFTRTQTTEVAHEIISSWKQDKDVETVIIHTLENDIENQKDNVNCVEAVSGVSKKLLEKAKSKYPNANILFSEPLPPKKSDCKEVYRKVSENMREFCAGDEHYKFIEHSNIINNSYAYENERHIGERSTGMFVLNIYRALNQNDTYRKPQRFYGQSKRHLNRFETEYPSRHVRRDPHQGGHSRPWEHINHDTHQGSNSRPWEDINHEPHFNHDLHQGSFSRPWEQRSRRDKNHMLSLLTELMDQLG